MRSDMPEAGNNTFTPRAPVCREHPTRRPVDDNHPGAIGQPPQIRLEVRVDARVHTLDWNDVREARADSPADSPANAPGRAVPHAFGQGNRRAARRARVG